MARPTGIVEAAIKLDGKQWEKTLDNLQGKTAAFVTDQRALGLAVAGGFAAASVSMGALTLGLKRSGDAALELRKNLSGAFSGGELDQVAATVARISALELKGLDEDELIEGAKRLGTFSDDVAGDLQRVANVSAKTGEKFGTLKDYFAEFTVNPAAQDTLKEIADIKPTELVKFGAVLDATGERILTTGKYAESAQKALRAVVDSKYGVAMADMASQTDKLNAELKLLSQDTGQAVAQMADNAAGALLPFVQSLRDLPTEIKAAAGVTTGLVSILTGAASTGITASLAISQIATNVKALGGAAKIAGGFTKTLATIGGISASAATDVLSLTGTAAGLTSGLAASSAAAATMGPAALGMAGSLDVAAKSTVTLGVAARSAALSVAALAAPFVAVTVAAAGFYAVGSKLIKNAGERERAEKSAAAASKAALKVEQDKYAVQDKTAKQLYDQGLTVQQLTAVLASYRQNLDTARKAGQDETVARLSEIIESLEKELAVLRKMEDRDRENFRQSGSTALTKDLDEANALIDYQRAQNKITEEQALKLKKDAVKQHVAEEKEQRMQLLALDTQLAQLRTQANKDATDKIVADQEAAREEAFAKEMHRVEVLRAQNKITEAEALERQDALLKKYDRSVDEKRSLELRQIEESTKAEEDAAAKVEAARKSKLDKELARIELLRTQNKISADQEIALLLKVLSTHKLTEDERAKLVQKRAQLQKQQRDKEAAEEKAARDKKAAEDKAAQEAAIDQAKQDAEDLSSAQQAGRDLEAGGLYQRVDRLQGQTEDTGKDNRNAIKQALEERLRLELESIKAEAEKAAAATKSADVRKQIEKNAQESIRQEILSSAEEYEDAMRRQGEALDEFKKKERGEEDSQFQVGYGIADFAEQLRREQGTTRRGRRQDSAPPLNVGTLNNLADVVNNAQTDFNPTSFINLLRKNTQEAVNGTIDVKVTATVAGGLADVDVGVTGLNGRLGSIEKAGRGLKGPSRVR